VHEIIAQGARDAVEIDAVVAVKVLVFGRDEGIDQQRRHGADRLEEPVLANTWERDERGEYARAVVEAVDPDSIDLDPLTVL
jgi:hypothetical protein